jgi:hypothetical protein
VRLADGVDVFGGSCWRVRLDARIYTWISTESCPGSVDATAAGFAIKMS